MVFSMVSMVVRTRSTVWCSEMTRVNSRGAEPKIRAGIEECAAGSRNHSTNAEMPDCATSPIQDRSCAESCPNHGSFASIAAIAAVASAPVAFCNLSARARCALVGFATFQTLDPRSPRHRNRRPPADSRGTDRQSVDCDGLGVGAAMMDRMSDSAGVAEAISALRAIGYYLERDRQPTHRVKAYRRAADTI